MNVLSLTQRRISAKMFAGITMVSLLLSAFPAAFFVAEAAAPDVIFSENFEANDGFSQWTQDGDWINVGQGGTSDGRKARALGSNSAGLLLADISTAGYENVEVSFDYRGILTSTAGNVVAVSYQTSNSGATNLEVFNNANAGDNTWRTFSQALPSVADDNAEFALRFIPSSFSAAGVEFDIDNVIVTGTPIPTACTGDSFETGDNTDPVQNTDSGEYFTTIQNAIDDCDTVDGHTIEVADGT
jgi:hypothetical protein